MNHIALVIRLIWAEWLRKKARFLLTLSAMTISSFLIISVIGVYDAMVSEYDDAAEAYMGKFDVAVMRNGRNAVFPPSLIEKVTASGLIQEVVPAKSMRAYVVSEKKYKEDPLSHRAYMGIPAQGPALVGIGTDASPFELEEGRWMRSQVLRPASEGSVNGDKTIEDKVTEGQEGNVAKREMPSLDEMEGVIGSAAAKFLKVQVGDKVVVTAHAQAYFVRIVGLVEQELSSPDIGRNPGFGSGIPLASIYLSLNDYDIIKGESSAPEILFIQLMQGNKLADFKEWLNREYPSLGSASDRDVKGKGQGERAGRAGASQMNAMDKGRVKENVMGPWDLSTKETIQTRLVNNRSTVQEKSQVDWSIWMSILATVFIIYTSLSIGVEERATQLSLLRCLGMTRGQVSLMIFCESVMFSVLGWAIGLVLALVGAGLLTSYFSWNIISLWSVGLSLACAVIGGALAAIIPMIKMVRLYPLSASMVDQPMSGKVRRWSWWFAGVGIILFFPAVYVLGAPGLSGETRVFYFSILGSPCFVLGTIAMTPCIIRGVERIMAPILSMLLGVPTELLRSQLSSHLARTMGTTICLTLGLSLFIGIQTWGSSMLVPFMPSRAMANTLVTFLPHGGNTENMRKKIAAELNISADEVLPCRNEQPKIAEVQRRSPGFEKIRQDNVVLMGVDVDKGFLADKPFFDLEWKDGDKVASLNALKNGRACLIPDSFQRTAGFTLGDKLLLTSNDGKTTYSYDIVGVVHIPGWHWLTKRSGIRRQGGFTTGLVIANIDQVGRDYPREETSCFWMNLPDDYSSDQLDAGMQRIAQEECIPPATISKEHYKPYCLVTELKKLILDIQARADSVIWAMCYLPLIAFFITLLAVGNTLMASVWSRVWELGLLRVLGLTKGRMFCLIVSEGLLIGLVACIMSLFMGVSSAWGLVELSNYTLGFGAMSPPFILPWDLLILACGSTMLLCVICSLIPAIWMSRKELITMLHEGDSL